MLYNIVFGDIVHFALKKSQKKYLEVIKKRYNFALAFKNEAQEH